MTRTRHYRPSHFPDPGFPPIVRFFNALEKLGLLGSRQLSVDEYLWLANYLARGSRGDGRRYEF